MHKALEHIMTKYLIKIKYGINYTAFTGFFEIE